MLTLIQTKAIISRVGFWNYVFSVFEEGNKRYLQASFLNADSFTGQPAMQRTRKWLLSEHMTPSELVQTCFKLVMTSLEHEAREGFTYKGCRVYGPHFDVEALVDLCQAKRLDYRKEASNG